MDKANLLRKIIGKVYRTTRGIMLDLNAYYNFMIERTNAKKKPKNRKIRVGFIVQYIPAWNKSEPLYRILKSDDRFETFLLCVQNGIKDGILLDTLCKDNDVYEWFIEHGYDEAINTYEGEERWIDLKKLSLDYVFYPRPYNSFMPKQYWSRYVSRYTKICEIIYSVLWAIELDSTLFNRDFFRNVSIYFAEFEDAKRICQRHYRLAHKMGFLKSYDVGMAQIIQVFKEQGRECPSWDFSQNRFRVLWTPRWTTDLEMGGSNFFTYKEEILDFAEQNPDIDFLFRPHPLMFSHLEETGELTKKEREEYFRRVENLPNVRFDVEKEYGSTFWNSSVLIGDMSGILAEFFATGNPIILCTSNYKLHTTQLYSDMFEACYKVESKEELFPLLKSIYEGNDPLKDKRKEVFQREFTRSLETAETERKILLQQFNEN